MTYEFVKVSEINEEIFDRLFTDSLPYLDPNPEAPNYDIFAGVMGADAKRQLWLDSYQSYLENGTVIECRNDGFTVGLWAGYSDAVNPSHGNIKFVLIGKDTTGSRSWANSVEFMLATRDFYVNAVCGFTSVTFDTPGPGSSLRWVNHLTTEVTENVKIDTETTYGVPDDASVRLSVQRVHWKFE